MGQSSSAATSTRPGGPRRYSRASGFTHWSDNIRDKKLIKINMRQTSESGGTFKLTYQDDSSDDFLSIRSTFVFTGKYQVERVGAVSGSELFGVGLPVSSKGDIVATATPKTTSGTPKAGGGEGKKTPAPAAGTGAGAGAAAGAGADDEERESVDEVGVELVGLGPAPNTSTKGAGKGPIASKRTDSTTVAVSAARNKPARGPGSEKGDAETTTAGGSSTTGGGATTDPTAGIRITRFVTEKLSCKLSEGKTSSHWTIEPSATPDCDAQMAWKWDNPQSKEHHTAPPEALNILGEEDVETGAIDLRIRIPQLAAGWDPPVVVLNDVTGWKLGKKAW